MSECVWQGKMDAPCTQDTVWISSDGKREYCQYHAEQFSFKGIRDLRYKGGGEPFPTIFKDWVQKTALGKVIANLEIMSPSGDGEINFEIENLDGEFGGTIWMTEVQVKEMIWQLQEWIDERAEVD